MKYSVITFGCRVNQADSFGLEEAWQANGAVSAPPETADVVVVNTCSVTATADQGARQTIRRIARDNPGATIVVTGCYATRRPAEIAALPNVAQVVGNDDKHRLVSLVRGVRLRPDVRGAETVPLGPDPTSNGDGPCGAAIAPGVAGRTAFTLRVQTGCAEPCSYCIIPSTRGTPRSVPVADVLREIDRAAASGFREIALTGVHLGSYGRDLDPRTSLVELFRAIESRRATLAGSPPSGSPPSRSSPSGEGTPILFRISSLEPMDCSREIVDLVACCDAFAPHFHLPLQHASNRVLAAMRRPYTIECYAALVDDIRTRIPHASIGSDIIVGFPGETDEDFDELAEYLERSPLTHVHVFPYSDRPGTPASAMGHRAPGGVVRERARRVREIGARLAERFRASQIGSVHRALTIDDGALAVTGNYLKLRIAPGLERNLWIRVRVTSDHHGELLRG